MPKIVIAAGGTAGHVVPALAIADELRARGADVFFVGTRERIEAELVPAGGYEISHLAVRGLDRRRPLRAAMALLRSVAATWKARKLLRQLSPDAVLAGGGYIAGPVGLAAVLARIPLVLTESDSRLGFTNRMLAPFAWRVCLAFPISGRGGERYLVTGRPVPAAVLRADRRAARERLRVDAGAPCLLVFGGSLGARSINEAALEAFAKDPPSPGGVPLVVLHVAGRRDHNYLSARLEELGRPDHYRLYDYLPETLADPLAASDLVVARAGGSVFELAAAGKPAVLVPYPHATTSHQESNARWFADAGAAVVLPDAKLTGQRLSRLVAELLGDRQRLSAMANAARRLARPDAAKTVAGELLGHAHRNQPWSGRRLHFVGIGGAGMSGLAIVARELGAVVSGCDRAESAYTQRLREAGIPYEIGHSADHVRDGVALVLSTAIPDDLSELRAARERGVTVIHRGALLAEVTSLRKLVAIAGTHGKTTTAAMAAHALRGAGMDAGFLIGGEFELGGDGRSINALLGTGDWIVAEADESDRSFVELSPEIAVVTNVELDHHTTYGSLLEVEDAFRSFLERLSPTGAVVIWSRPELRQLVPGGRRIIGFDVFDADSGADAELTARNLRQLGPRSIFELFLAGRRICEVDLPVGGRHNVLNALAALGVCHVAGADLERAAASLRSFRPAARRFQQKGEAGGVRVFDDYAHHPSEIRATLEAARSLEPRRLIAVFQPHLYSRTLHLHRELGRELAQADVAVVLDVYPARERPEGRLAGVSGKLVADACADYASGRPVWWLPSIREAGAVLERHLADGDLLVTLGAGDVDQLAEQIVARIDGGKQA